MYDEESVNGARVSRLYTVMWDDYDTLTRKRLSFSCIRDASLGLIIWS